jgi:hypothetical protein
MHANKPHTTAKKSIKYKFDYKKARPNRFIGKMKDGPLVIVLDPDVAKIFTNTKQVNKALRALISAMPK